MLFQEFILHNLFNYLPIKTRIIISYSCKNYHLYFLDYKHSEIIDIYYNDFRLINKFKNLKFKTELWHSKITTQELKHFEKIYSLNLFCCYNFNDTYNLKNIHKLSLFGCKYVTNVDALTNIHTLDLSFCINLVDISKLGNNNIVLLRYCKKITDISSLKNIKIINISFCNNIVDISMLQKLDKIYMYDTNPVLLNQINQLTSVKFIKY